MRRCRQGEMLSCAADGCAGESRQWRDDTVEFSEGDACASAYRSNAFSKMYRRGASFRRLHCRMYIRRGQKAKYWGENYGFADFARSRNACGGGVLSALACGCLARILRWS